MDIELLKQMIDEKMIRVQKHPIDDLWIYNYTEICQYSRTWNEVTLQCRGLILDSNFEVIARGFSKFFNYEELDSSSIPNLPFDVYQKVDGSLGILYWRGDVPYIATRGSFVSEQATHASRILQETIIENPEIQTKLNRNSTYLFEIIYPENRIVVDYNDLDTLILLAVIDTKTGKDLPLENIGFPIVKKYDGLKDIDKLKELEQPNEEGFVIKFSNDFRMKIKFEDYKRLHKIITNVSTVNIWEYLSENKPLDELLQKVPDEFYDWVNSIVYNLETEYSKIENECKSVFKVLDTRKETAEYFKDRSYPSVLFKMLDNQDYSKIIWKIIKPEYSKPFSNREGVE